MEQVAIFILSFIIQAIIIISLPYSANKRNKIFFLLFFVELSFLAGFRGVDVYNDSIAYATHFQLLEESNLFKINFLDRFEPSYLLLEKFVKFYIVDSFYFLFLVTSIFTQYFILRFLYKNSPDFLFSCILYIFQFYYFFAVSGIRQGLAVSICCIAYDYVSKSKFKFIFFVLLASTFHYSALIFIFILFFKKIEMKKKYIVWITVISFALFQLLSPLIVFLVNIFNYGGDYLKQGFSSAKLGILILALNLILMFFLVYKKFFRLSKKDINLNIMFWCLFLSIVIRFMSVKFGILNRFAYYFILPSYALLPNLFLQIKDSKLRFMLKLILAIIFIIELLVVLYYRPEWFKIIPYKFNWQ